MVNNAAENPGRLGARWVLGALVLGGLAAVLSSFVLFGMGAMWLSLVATGLLCLIGALLSPSMARYWLAILLISIPFKMGKIFANPVAVQEYVGEWGFPPGALPVFNLILTDIPFLVLMILCGLEIAGREQRLRMDQLTWWAVAAVAWAGLSCIKAVLLDAALWELARLIQYVLFFLLAVWFVRSRSELRLIVYVAAASVAFQGVYCVGQYFFDLNTLLFGADATTASNTSYSGEAAGMVAESGVFAGRRRGGGVGQHGNVTAQYFEFWLPYVVAAAFAARGPGLRILMWGSLVLTLTGLAFTFSRGGAIAIAFGTVMTILALLHSGRISRSLGRGLVGLGLLAIVAGSPSVYLYMTTRPQMLEDRFWLARVAWSMIHQNPILGVGLNQHMARFDEFDPDNRGQRERIHLYYLALAAERGVPGALFFVIFYFGAVRAAWRNTRARDPAAGLIAAGAFGALSAGAVHMTFDLFFIMSTQWSLWFGAGLAVACGRIAPEAKADVLAPAAAPERAQ